MAASVALHIPLPLARHFGPAGRSGCVRLWNPAWMGMFAGPGLPSVADAAGQALYVEMTSANVTTYPAGAVLNALQARPGLTPIAKGLFYAIGGVQWVVNPDVGDSHWPPNAFMFGTARNADPGAGNRDNAAFQSGNSPNVNGSWLGNMAFDTYAKEIVAYYTGTGGPGSAVFDASGFAHGVMPDVCGVYPSQVFSNINGTPAFPWNFDSGLNAMYSSNRWLDYTSSLGSYLRSALGKSADGKTPNWVTCNGISDGPQYFDGSAPTSRLLDQYDGVMVEEWIRSSGDSPTTWPTEAAWQQCVDMLFDAAVNYGKPIFLCSKLWPQAAGTTATQAQSKQWLNFTLGSFLLGSLSDQSCGRHQFHYRHDNANLSLPVTTSGGHVQSLGTNQGVAVGQQIRLAGMANGANNGNHTITAATATTCDFAGIVNGDSGTCSYIQGTDGDASGTDMMGRHNWRPDVNFWGYYDIVAGIGQNVDHVNYPGSGVASLKKTDTYVGRFTNGFVLLNPTTSNAGASRLTLPPPGVGRAWTSLDGATYSGAVPAIAAHTALILVAI